MQRRVTDATPEESATKACSDKERGRADGQSRGIKHDLRGSTPVQMIGFS